jgi:hypothetical protein
MPKISNEKIFKLILVIGFLIGAYDHYSIITIKGFLSSRQNINIFANLFWDLLLPVI